MTPHSEIDETLRRLGSVDPPLGLERRVRLRLQTPRPRFSLRMLQLLSAGALAASVALTAALLNPALRSLVFHHRTSSQTLGPAGAPRVIAPASGGFGAASAVHVPAEPVPVLPTPVNQGRGHSRSRRAVLPNGTLAPLPRGVAPAAPPQR